MMRGIALLLYLGLAASMPARADVLTGLRSTLAALPGKSPIVATLKIARSASQGEAATTANPAEASFDARDDGNGLQLSYSTTLLDRIDDEAVARSRDSEAKTPLQDLLRETGPIQVGPLLSQSAQLLRRLERATLVEQKDDQLDGKPATLLVLDVPANLPARERESINEFKASLQLWLDADGVPIALQHRQTFKGRRMMIGFGGGSSEATRFVTVGDRLVAVSQTREQSFNGFGQNNESRTRISLVPRP